MRLIIVLVLLAVVACISIGAYAWVRWKEKVADAKLRREFSRSGEKRRPINSIRDSIVCEPEVIRPPEEKKGPCGIPGCRIQYYHSHVMDLAKRLKEDK